jgi:toxic protein SymE
MKKHNPSSTSRRRLKIAAKYVVRESLAPVVFPEIRLCGKWLQELGFSCGEMVIVQFKNSQLIITSEKPPDSTRTDFI